MNDGVASAQDTRGLAAHSDGQSRLLNLPLRHRLSRRHEIVVFDFFVRTHYQEHRMRQTLGITVIALCLGVLFPAPASADVRADYMADMCRTIATAPSTTGLQLTYDNGFCRGLFEVVERLISSGSTISDPPYAPFSRVCRPTGWLRGWGDRNGSDVLIAVFVRHVEKLPPARRQESFLSVAIESLEQAFLCRR